MFNLAERHLTDRSLLERVGALMLEDTEENFDDQRDPDGNAWEPLSKNTKAAKRAGGRIGWASGALQRSFAWRVQGNSRVAWGTNLKQGLFMQKGTGKWGPKKKSYIIRPKNKKALAFKVAGKSGGEAGGGSKRDVKGRFVKGASRGDQRFARCVIHPGQPPRRFLGVGPRAMRKLVRYFGEETAAAFQKGGSI